MGQMLFVPACHAKKDTKTNFVASLNLVLGVLYTFEKVIDLGWDSVQDNHSKTGDNYNRQCVGITVFLGSQNAKEEKYDPFPLFSFFDKDNT